jgi:hypothetical protein
LLGQDGSFLYILPYLWERDCSVSAGPILFMLPSLWKEIIWSNRVISLYITLSLGKRLLSQGGSFLYILPYLWERDCWVKLGHFSTYYLISGKEIAGSSWVISLYIILSLGKRLFGVCWLKWLSLGKRMLCPARPFLCILPSLGERYFMVKLSHFSLYCSIFFLGKILFGVFWTSFIYVTISLERDYLVKQGHFSIYYRITWKEIAGSRWVISLYKITLSLGKRLLTA